jgi:hypothetical protein
MTQPRPNESQVRIDLAAGFRMAAQRGRTAAEAWLP